MSGSVSGLSRYLFGVVIRWLGAGPAGGWQRSMTRKCAVAGWTVGAGIRAIIIHAIIDAVTLPIPPMQPEP